MKIEKISNNKLKFVFSERELEKENIDYHSFMAGSSKCENIIANLLYIAKDELDFDTKNCNIEIETFEITHGNFIMTVTRFEKSPNRLLAKRKQGNIENHTCIYEFDSLDNYSNFLDFLNLNYTDLYKKLKENSEFLTFNNKNLLITTGLNFSDNEIKFFNSSITEFAKFISNSSVLISKIKEAIS